MAHKKPHVEQTLTLQPGGNTGRQKARRGRDARALDAREALGRADPVGPLNRGPVGQRRPSVSGRPAMRLRFCTAWLAAPFIKLSITPKAMSRPEA